VTALDDDMIIHVRLNLHWFSAIGVNVLLDLKLNTSRLELVQSIPQFNEEHFFTVLLEEVKISIGRGH